MKIYFFQNEGIAAYYNFAKFHINIFYRERLIRKIDIL